MPTLESDILTPLSWSWNPSSRRRCIGLVIEEGKRWKMLQWACKDGFHDLGMLMLLTTKMKRGAETVDDIESGWPHNNKPADGPIQNHHCAVWSFTRRTHQLLVSVGRWVSGSLSPQVAQQDKSQTNHSSITNSEQRWGCKELLLSLTSLTVCFPDVSLIRSKHALFYQWCSFSDITWKQ